MTAAPRAFLRPALTAEDLSAVRFHLDRAKAALSAAPEALSGPSLQEAVCHQRAALRLSHEALRTAGGEE